MKSKNVAFGLNFLLAGAGFAYLGRWKPAATNLAGTPAIGITLAFLLPGSTFDRIDRFIGIGSASGAWAMQVAEEMNAVASETPSMDELSDEARLP
mgnify:CR=1 FL=1